MGGLAQQVHSFFRQTFEVVPDVVTVKFRRGLAPASQRDFLQAKNVRRLRANHLGVVDISVPAGMDAVSLTSSLAARRCRPLALTTSSSRSTKTGSFPLLAFQRSEFHAICERIRFAGFQ